MVQTQGKQNKVVATLLTHDMIAAMDLLVKHRKQCGLKDSNPYIFATQGEGHLPTWQVIQTMATAAGCKHPELITSSRLRKYIATVCQVFSILLHKAYVKNAVYQLYIESCSRLPITFACPPLFMSLNLATCPNLINISYFQVLFNPVQCLKLECLENPC
jgi:hypothetical protein